MSAVLLARSFAAAMVLLLLPRTVLPLSARLAFVLAVGVGIPSVATFFVASSPSVSATIVTQEFTRAMIAAGTLSVPFVTFRIFARWACLQTLPNAKLLETVLVLAGLVTVFESHYPTRMIHAVARTTGGEGYVSFAGCVELFSAGLGAATLLVLPLIVASLFASVLLAVGSRMHHFTLPAQANELVRAMLMLLVLFWSYALFESYLKRTAESEVPAPQPSVQGALLSSIDGALLSGIKELVPIYAR